MPARAIASGTIAFGLVSIPVKLYTATSTKDVHFHMLHARDSGRLWQGRALRIVGSKSLARAYARAFKITGYEAEALDGSDLVVAGLLRLVRAGRLFPVEVSR